MCSGAGTPKDEKQGNIEANKVHVYTPPPTTTLIILYYATFTLCPRWPRQSRFRPPWTKRGDRNTT